PRRTAREGRDGRRDRRLRRGDARARPARESLALRPRRRRRDGRRRREHVQHLDRGGPRDCGSRSGRREARQPLGLGADPSRPPPLPPERRERSIDELGSAFLSAQAPPPAMRHAAPVRRELATRTVFNVLGPLTTPAGARALVLGVYSPTLARTLAEALVQLD